MKLRKHQVECFDNIKNHFKDDNKALIKMFCGSGKSLIIYDCLLEYTNNLSVVVVPSINLITQFNKDYLLKCERYDLLTICSKNELKEISNSNKTLTFTTDEEEILNFLEENENKIVLVTYQSLKLFADIIKDNDIMIDLMCFDEAHHILSDGMKSLLFGFDEDNNEDNNEDIDEDEEDTNINFLDNNVTKTLFFTATPKNSNHIKMFEIHNMVTINDTYYDIIDDEDNMNCYDVPHCGKMIYEYMHIDGVNDNILNDFKIRVDLYTENKDYSIFEAISRTILETGNNRVLTFHSRSETKSDKGSNVLSFVSEENYNNLIKCFRKVLKKEYPHLKGKYKTIQFEGITANTKNKISILEEFDKTTDDNIFILASCKTIGEGIDTKNANMVCFVDPKQSYVEIIQNIGRICRKNENTKQLGTVLIPCYVDINKYKDCKNNEEKNMVIRQEMSKAGDFNGILNVLSALRQEDPYMFELCLQSPEFYTNKELEDNFKKNKTELDTIEYTKEELFKLFGIKYKTKKNEIDNFKLLSNHITQNIIITNKKISEDDITIDNNYEETIYFVKTEKDTYMKVKGNVYNKITSCGLRPHRNIKPDCHINNDIKVLWDFENDISDGIFGGYIKATVIPSSEEQWMERLEEVKKYIDENGKRPIKENQNLEIKQLGTWIGTQLYTYKLNKMIKTRIPIWEKFIKDYNKCFISFENNWLLKYNNFIKDNDKYRDWFNNQKQNYKKQRGFYKNMILKQKWENLIQKYPKLFENFDEKWNNTLLWIDNYMSLNNQRPNKIENNYEYRWLTTQSVDYKKKRHLMKQDIYRQKWELFTNKYPTIFTNIDTIWIDNYNLLYNYIKDNREFPNSKKENTRNIAKWYNHQKDKIKENKLSENKLLLINKLKEQFPNIMKSEFDIWKDTLQTIINFINQNNKLPIANKNNELEFKLASWIQNQKRNYKNNDRNMKNINFKQPWTEFINDPKYKKYFTKDDDKEQPEEKKEIIISPPSEEKQPSISIKLNRPEQDKLRQYLIQNKENKCVLCNTKKSVKLLETAHLKPHCDLDTKEKYDVNIVEFMCFECHKLYDDGELGINNGILNIKDIVEYPQYEILQNKKVECYNNKNKIYFDYHFENIYNK